MQISPAALRLPLDTSYARLPERFFARAEPQPVAAPRLIKLNVALAEQLGLDPEALSSAAGVQLLAGNVAPEGATPIALSYAGHQFGNFVPLLGDGRAVLLGEVVGRDGQRRDIQLKGSGPTPFSRRGDGRAALGPVLREYVLSESMAALGIPTTRALAAVTTGEAVYREEALPGAVFARVAASHIRVGTFQLFASRGDTEGLQLLAEHAIARHYPGARAAANPVLALFEGVVARQAALVARWLLVGFIHGVMNTDNCAISGETIDYGPCAFLDAYHPGTVFSSIDAQGRYAYGNQPRIAQWNLARLGECLLPLFDADENKALELAQGALAGFAPQFQAAYLDGLRRKFGLMAPRDDDAELMQDLLGRMAENEADFTLVFRHLADAAADPGADAVLRALFNDPAAFDAWAPRWRARLAEEGGDPAARRAAMRSSNPAVIPRNHQLQAVIDAAVRREDFAPFEALLEVLSRPFEDRPPGDRYTLPPQPEERVLRTFCGT